MRFLYHTLHFVAMIIYLNPDNLRMLYFKVVKFLIFLLMYGGIVFANSTEEECPSLSNADSLSQTQLLHRLTHSCRYDRFERPAPTSIEGELLPVDVHVRAYIYFMQNLEAHDLQFKIYALLQLRYMDQRLVFRKVAPTRKQPILGEHQFKENLWMPHIFLANERDSSILGTTDKNVLTSISPDGIVIFSTRIQATLYCWLNLKKFPFDEQHCPVVIESWIFNNSELVLHWEAKRPITFDPDLRLTEYVLRETWSNETVINADMNDLRHGAFAGNYSALSFTMSLRRVVGYYIMGYFFPSMLIVGISWLSFWLQADQVGPRLMLGTSTMLTFITLATTQGKSLPKVSYIKVSEVWFFACTLFIFGSLIEFAFVNTLWRRKNNINVTKLSSKYIFKAKAPRRHRTRANTISALNGSADLFNTYSSDEMVLNIPSVAEHVLDCETKIANFRRRSLLNLQDPASKADAREHIHCTTFTPQEVSMWIDSKARYWFPLAFLIFNAFFWTSLSFQNIFGL